ncbi:hypothetical protein ID866_6422 [Astraeus odoratus]|nr:hypothetical protein ID866_6422 [Astraeus odoratus]
MQLGHGIYKFLNRQSGTAMDMVGDTVVGPSCLRIAPDIQWEIQPLGDGFMIRNVQTQKYLSVKALFRSAPVIATSYPTAWHINKVYLPDENAVFYERTDQLPSSHATPTFTFTPGQIQMMDEALQPEQHRCRLWKALFTRGIGRGPTHQRPAAATALPKTHTNGYSFNTAHNNTTGTALNGGVKRTSPPPALNIRGQQSTLTGPKAGSAYGYGNAHNGHANSSFYNPAYPAPAPLTANRSVNRGPGAPPSLTRAPMTGIGSGMGVAKTQAPVAPSTRGSAASGSSRSSMGDSQRLSGTSPTAVFTNGGDLREGVGYHPGISETKGGGVRGFFSRLTGGRADKAGKSKDF